MPTMTTRQRRPPCEANVDIGIIIDGSGSIRDANPQDGAYDNWNLLLQFVASIIDQLTVGQSNTRIGAVLFSDRGELLFPLNRYDSKDDVQAVILATRYPGANTNTSGGIYVASTQLFNTNNGDRPDVQNLAIILTDGKSTFDNHLTIPYAEALRAKNVEMIAIGITNSVDSNELRALSSMPQELNKNYFTSANFQELDDILEGLVEQACVVTLSPSNCPNDVDVVFVVDSSGSIGEARFALMKAWLSNVVGGLDLENGRSRVGILQFSDSTNLLFNLNQFRTRANALAAIDGMRFIRGTTNTGDALRYAWQQMFTAQNGDREGIPNLLIILTDGGSNDKAKTVREAVTAKNKGMHLIAMGIGNWTDEYELTAISSFPYEQNYIKVGNFEQLARFTTQLTDVICNRVNECANNPCRNGQCIDGFGMYMCECAQGFGGVNCDRQCQNPADVVIALDSSGSIDKKNFQRMVDFATKAILNLPIGAGTRVGLLTFADDSTIYVNLADHTTRMRLMNGLAVPFFTGGTTNTASALRTMWQRMFTSAGGDQPSRPNVGVVITDGKSNDMMATWREAMQARQRDITMLSVGVGRFVRVGELEAMASEPSARNVFSVEDFENLNQVSDRLLRSVCNDINECQSNPCRNGGQCVDLMNGYRCECRRGFSGVQCERLCDGQADVAFLLDKSGSIRNDRWIIVQNFVNFVISNMEVGPTKVQVAAATFDDNAALEFKFNQYKNKEDVMMAMRNIKHGGGRTNTAAGLEVVRQQIFRPDAGDRQNVPNYLVILTDGNSNVRAEETLPQAIAARIEGIYIVTVAIGSLLNMMELRGLSSNPVDRNVLTVQSFAYLNNLRQPLIMSMCDDFNECQSNPCQSGGTCINGLKKYVCVCPRERTGENCDRTCRRQYDMVFLLDFSGSVELAYNRTISFMRRVIYGLEFRFDRVRLGVATYADDADLRFNLNTYTDKQDILNALSFPKSGGRTNTQAVLRLASEQMLTRRVGARTGVPDIVVIITDGGSNVNPENTIPAARVLKSRGAQVYAVGIGEMADLNELQQIATNPSSPYVLRVNSVQEVNQMADRLLDSLCQ